MSTLRSITALCALAAAALVTSAFAQERSSPTRPPSGGPIPAGSYQSTCRGASMNGNMLSAQCTGPTGAPIFSSIDTNGCRGRDIANDRGYLRCNASGGGPRPPVPPRPVPPPQPTIPTGSYQRSCRGITINGNILRAQCTNGNGAPVSSSIDVNGCRGQDIYNDNGRLRCGGSSPQPPRPPVGGGGGNFQAIAYTSANYRGRMLTISGPVDNLAASPGFNDNIRSIRIIRGRAQLCVDARYRGRCVTIDQSYSDLNRIGMANRISSIR